MQIKILQLNMWAGMRFPALKEFLTQHNNEFDILCFQEVAGPRHRGNVYTDRNSHEELQQVLSGYQEAFVQTNTYEPTPDASFEGNAIFYRKEFHLLSQDVLWLYKRDAPFPESLKTYEQAGRSALITQLQIGNKSVHVISAHLAWAPTPLEQPHQRKQNLKLIEYVKNLSLSWILTGDFNIQADQPSILDLEKYGHNLPKEYDVKNTLDPTIHTAWHLIDPGFPVDYIFVSPDVKVDSFQVLDTVHMSDHFGLTTTVEI